MDVTEELHTPYRLHPAKSHVRVAVVGGSEFNLGR